MRVLLVNQHTVPVFADIAIAFATQGHDVTLFAGHVEAGARWQADQARVHRSFRYRRSSSFARLFTWMAFTTHYFLYLLVCRKPDHILVSTNPPLAPLVTRWVARLRSIPFHVLVYDLYPDALSQAGFTSQSNFLYRRWQRANITLYRQAKGTFTLSESMKSALSAYADLSSVKVIPNWSDVDYIKPLAKTDNPFIADHGLEGKFVVMYSGNMGLTHDLESVVEAAGLLRDRTEIVFVLIGDGGRKNSLLELASRNKLTNVKFLDYQDAMNFPLAAAAADVGVVTLGTGAEGISVPSKTYVSLAAGQGILAIAPPESELSRIVSEFGVGYSVSPHDARQLARHITFLVDHPDELARLKAISREVSMKFTTSRADEYVSQIAGLHQKQ